MKRKSFLLTIGILLGLFLLINSTIYYQSHKTTSLNVDEVSVNTSFSQKDMMFKTAAFYVLAFIQQH